MMAVDVQRLYDALKHGDQEHKDWLRSAILAYYEGSPIPPVNGSGNKEARIKELECEIYRLKARYEF